MIQFITSLQFFIKFVQIYYSTLHLQQAILEFRRKTKIYTMVRMIKKLQFIGKYYNFL